MNGDQRDYWKEKYEREVLGKSPPKEYLVDGFVKPGDVVKDAMEVLRKQFKGS